MKKPQTLYLIDGSSYIFRAFFAIRQPLSTSRGLPTNALYGFINMLQKVVREEKPDYLAVVFDSKEKTFRHKMYPEYKAHREVPPEDLAKQFPYFEPLVAAYNIATLRMPGYEADDIIGTLAAQGEKKGLHVVIVSGDKDMMQLIGPRVHMLDTMKDKIFREKDVEEKFGVGPAQVIDVMGLMGDSSDNIPGVKGVGPKTATELIQKFHSMEELYTRIGEIDKKKLKEKLETDRENARLSKQLVTIDTAVDLPLDLDELKVEEPDQEALTRLFGELEFTSLLPKGKNDAAEPARAYETILDEKRFSELLGELKKAGEFALDLETTSLNPVAAEAVGISFSFNEGEACYLPVGHRYLGAPKQLNRETTFRRLKPLLEDPKIKKIGHNIKYDLIVLSGEGVALKGIAFDTMIASYLLDPSRRGHGLDELARELLGHKTLTYKEVVGTASKEIGFDEVDIERATEYAAEDSDVTFRLAANLRPKLTEETLKLYETLEMPLMEVLAEMEMNGVLIDTGHLKSLSKSIERDMRKHEKAIFESAGEEFNINSPKQLAVILFEKLKLPVKKKTKTGYSTDVSVLEELALEHELPDKILAYRQLGKLKSTYVDTLPLEICKKTGRVHTSFNQTVAATGRLSSSDPNLQNIPIRSPLGKEIRRAFIAEGEGRLLAADYSQIELRILAHLSRDEALSAAFKKGEDIHSRTAAEIFGTPIDRVDENTRRMAKAVNFGIVYGLSAFGLSRQLKIPPREAKEFIDQYFALYRRVKTYIEDTVEQAHRLGYTTTLMNRRRYLPDLASKNKQVREAAERVAINSPIQGSAADLIKVAMVRLSNQLKKKKLRSKMILQVHDELVFECPQKEKAVLHDLVKKEMEGVYEFNVPLLVHIGWGANWNEAH
ncbi:MAG: DNA polymerase I [Nitrospinaceae bacterium]|nr:MAG: DNA polymerase I [Nitrospinaceae bacterium]